MGVDILFTNHGVDVQDPLMGQVLGIGRKVGCMFEVQDLKILSQVVSATATTTTFSPDLWHACLGRTFLSHLQLLASQGYLGSIYFPKFDCTSCHFGKQTKLSFNNSVFFLLHLLILYILIFGVWHQFPLRGDLDILSYL